LVHKTTQGKEYRIHLGKQDSPQQAEIDKTHNLQLRSIRSKKPPEVFRRNLFHFDLLSDRHL